jgi:hypothetical protein
MEIVRAFNHAVVATEWMARLIVLMGALLVLYYAADRAPPFRLVSSEPAEAQAGEFVTIRSVVRRDTARGCNAEFSRFIFDAAGARFDLGTAAMSADAIAKMERLTPGRLVLSFRVPNSMAPGPAVLQTVVYHQCNRVHALWPIVTTIEMPFVVLP